MVFRATRKIIVMVFRAKSKLVIWYLEQQVNSCLKGFPSQKLTYNLGYIAINNQ